MRCYYNDHLGEEKRCRNEATHNEYWCSPEHERDWQYENYEKKVKDDTSKLTIKDLQERIKQMGKEAK